VPSFNARSTAVTVFASTPRPTRTLTPSISTSIIPAPGSTGQRGILRCRQTDREDGATSSTAGTNCGSSAGESAVCDACNCRRQPNICCGDILCRRATAETDSPLTAISATIRALSSSLHVRRRPAPVNTSSRCSASTDGTALDKAYRDRSRNRYAAPPAAHSPLAAP
jgi:hypothetical protein